MCAIIMRFGACLCFARVWLSNDRATQKSMMDYAKEYLAYGIEVSELVFELLVMRCFVRLVQWTLTLGGLLVSITSYSILKSIQMQLKWYFYMTASVSQL